MQIGQVTLMVGNLHRGIYLLCRGSCIMAVKIVELCFLIYN